MWICVQTSGFRGKGPTLALYSGRLLYHRRRNCSIEDTCISEGTCIIRLIEGNFIIGGNCIIEMSRRRQLYHKSEILMKSVIT